ncbi:WbuC family cupin fold metalloprotein [Pyxidicoccus caerfyrddinensis]|uniref:WbuC family cupin fold metalloprotein n=1 Tax=Pyxidicoccus caerfyrddinensis TaxID=2709663 RepID=UPI0013D97AEB
MLLALQPGTYVRPHRHPRPPGRDGFELLCVVQGALGVVAFEEDGRRALPRRFGLSKTGGTVSVVSSATAAIRAHERPGRFSWDAGRTAHSPF